MINNLHTRLSDVIQILSASFSPLRVLNLRIYWGGQTISLLGTWMQVTAQSWVVWELSHAESALGIVSMLGSLPMLLFGLWAGVWIDRLDRRKILIGSQTAAMLLAFVLAALVATKAVQLWHVYVLSFLLGCVTAIDFPAQQTFIGDLAGMSEVRKAIVVNAMLLQIGRMLGPALAGFVMSATGAALAFLLNGLSFIAVIVSLLIVRSHQTLSPSKGSALKAVMEGLRFIRSQPRIQDIIALSVLVAFFGISLLSFFPSLADEVLHGDASTLGLLLASSGAGALVSTLIVTPLLQTRRRLGRVMALCVMWAGTWWMLGSLSRVVPLSMFCVFTGALATPTVLTTANGLLQTMAPPQMRGRVLSAFILVSFGIQPVSALLIGFMADHYGTPIAILFNGGAMITLAAALLIFRRGLASWVPKPKTDVVVQASH
ncbi:MAG: MFS transporter [Thermoflexales bacterium]|nr:MFS transporter [Thermoflexales bacterium]